jgi:LysM repeat protein
MHYRMTWAAIAAICCISMAGDAFAKNSHVVSAGDTLWGISRSYGCNVKAIRQVNSLGDAHLAIGQELEIPSCEDRRVAVAVDKTPIGTLQPKSKVISHRVTAGDTLSEIAAQYKSSVGDIQARNQLSDTTILVGGNLFVLPEVGEGATKHPRLTKPKSILGQSVGLPHRGKLKKAIRLRQGKGYFIRRPHRSFGATHTVGYLKNSLAQMKKRFPKTHDLAIGDLSARGGGKITMHASHQSGRDVDIGFYFKKKPKGYPESFIVANRKNIDFKASWALLTQFTNLAKKPDGVDRIFMTYSTQKMFYKLARKDGIAKKRLNKIFQYPKGRYSQDAIIRHEPGHDEHIHVRFKCPPKDKGCH